MAAVHRAAAAASPPERTLLHKRIHDILLRGVVAPAQHGLDQAPGPVSHAHGGAAAAARGPAAAAGGRQWRWGTCRCCRPAVSLVAVMITSSPTSGAAAGAHPGSGGSAAPQVAGPLRARSTACRAAAWCGGTPGHAIGANHPGRGSGRPLLAVWAVKGRPLGPRSSSAAALHPQTRNASEATKEGSASPLAEAVQLPLQPARPPARGRLARPPCARHD